METVLRTDDLVRDRYRIVRPLGRGGTGTTYEAEDLQTHRRVAIKVVSLRQVKDWKILELLEREAKVLQNLDRPEIPKYLDYFHTDEEEDRHFYLVRELIEGDSLAAKVAKGWRPKERQVREIAIQVLEILDYLHGLRPPVVHRDIKPENILMQPDGKIFLIDFGAVQDVYRNTFTREGSFAGTLGYVPPEQFRGRAVPATDLYALGATLLFLLTGKSPEEFPYNGLRIDFRDRVKASKEFTECLEILLEPAVEDRFQQPAEAIAALEKQQIPTRYVPSRYRQPKGSKITLKRTEKSLAIEILPGFPIVPAIKSAIVGTLILGVPYVAFKTLSAAIADLSPADRMRLQEGFTELLDVEFLAPTFLPYTIFFSLAILVLAFVFVRGTYRTFSELLRAPWRKVRLEFDRDSFRIQRTFWGRSHQARGRNMDIDRINICRTPHKNPQKKQCQIVEGTRTHFFGESLTLKEKRWLVAEVNDFLDKEISVMEE